MMKKILLEYVLHSMWCCGGGLVLWCMNEVLSNLVVSCVYPVLMFYCLYFWYDRSSVVISRWFKVIEEAGR